MKIASLPWTNVSIHVEETSQKLKAFAQKLCVTVARPCFLRPKAAFPSLKKARPFKIEGLVYQPFEMKFWFP